MNDAIPELSTFDELSLDRSFAVLTQGVLEQAARLKTSQDREDFRLFWLGRKQGRLKLISESWFSKAPPEARKALGIRFNELKRRIEAALEAANAAGGISSPKDAIDITL